MLVKTLLPARNPRGAIVISSSRAVWVGGVGRGAHTYTQREGSSGSLITSILTVMPITAGLHSVEEGGVTNALLLGCTLQKLGEAGKERFVSGKHLIAHPLQLKVEGAKTPGEPNLVRIFHTARKVSSTNQRVHL